MRSSRVIHVVDSHTEGMPTRVVTGGAPLLPGDTMAQRREYLTNHRDDLRTFLMYEPRGHSAMSGAILQPPTRPDADVGVVFIEVSGCLPMCGHGAIGVATVLAETGMVPVTEPVTTIRLDTPAGLVVASVKVEQGRATAVTIQNVPPSWWNRTRWSRSPATATSVTTSRSAATSMRSSTCRSWACDWTARTNNGCWRWASAS